jgi:prepilin-type N-terminal cleavage/methylation domain-containing protein
MNNTHILNGFKMPKICLKAPHGFTLIEMAIVLIIFGLILAAILTPLQAQRDLQARKQTQDTLENAKKALLGFAQANGRLPCPATNNGTGIFPDDSGIANPNINGPCNQLSGFLPASTLGVQPSNAQGFAIDGWDNPIRYAVNQNTVDSSTGVATVNVTLTNAVEMTNTSIAILKDIPSLRVCRSAPTFNTTCSAPPTSTENNFLTNNAVAVVFSTGRTGAISGGVEETENLNGNSVFISHDSTVAGAPNGEFDHIVTWISPFLLYQAMIEAGQLR